MDIARKRDMLRRELARIEAEMDALAALPQQDEFPDQTIVRCVVDTGTKQFTYVFLKVIGPRLTQQERGYTYTAPAEERWYFTGGIAGPTSRWVTWSGLVDFLTSRRRTVSSWDVLWPQIAATHPAQVQVVINDESTPLDRGPGAYTYRLGKDGLYR